MLNLDPAQWLGIATLAVSAFMFLGVLVDAWRKP